MTINTKYNIDDIVWTMLNNRPQQLIIYGIDLHISKNNEICVYKLREFSYSKKSCEYGEDYLFSTKEDLIESL